MFETNFWPMQLEILSYRPLVAIIHDVLGPETRRKIVEQAETIVVKGEKRCI